MPVRYVSGNIFDSSAEVLVNPVNTKGVMGKGLARQFKGRFPDMFEEYRKTCQSGRLHPGDLHVYDKSVPVIMNLATKDHWIDPSNYDYIYDGLHALRYDLESREYKSCAIPALGCGNGRLDWGKVRDLIEEVLSSTSVDIEVYEPK